ncbi:MAG: SRPBCC family protein [Nocardioidaceae bacterium]|nr:SRPBCC family protein [Nocardioidaceae bacterium]
MPTIERTVETTADLDAVWSYLSDFTTTTEWDPGTVQTVRSSGDGGVGTTYENTSEFNGRRTELTYTVVEHAAPHRIVLRGEGAQVVATDTMTLSAHGSGTRVHYRAVLEFRGLLGLVGPLMSLPLLNRPFVKLGDEAELGMCDALARL